MIQLAPLMGTGFGLPSMDRWLLTTLVSVGLTVIHLRLVKTLDEPSPDEGEPLPGYATLFSDSEMGRVRALITILIGAVAAFLPSVVPLWLSPMLVVLSSGVLVLCAIDAWTTWVPSVFARWCLVELVIALALGALLGAGTLGLGGVTKLVAGAFLGATFGYVMFYLIWKFTSGLGFGDVRLAGLIGAVSGAVSLNFWFVTMLAASLVGILIGVVTLLTRRVRPSVLGTAFPYGPALWLGPYLSAVATCLLL